jgi:hypothetical protein
MVDRLEKVARLVLWLAIAATFVIVPLEYVRAKRSQSKAEEDLQEAVKKAEAKTVELETREKERKSHRISLASMGTYLSGIDYSKTTGNVWATNVSPRSGTLCLIGQAADPDVTTKTSESIPACTEVSAYATVHVSLGFGGDLSNTCPRSNCRLTLREAPEARE